MLRYGYDCNPSETLKRTLVHTKRMVQKVTSPWRDDRKAVRVIITYSCKAHLCTTRLIIRPIVIEGKCNRIS